MLLTDCIVTSCVEMIRVRMSLILATGALSHTLPSLDIYESKLLYGGGGTILPG